jgi:hypothetical protein
MLIAAGIRGNGGPSFTPVLGPFLLRQHHLDHAERQVLSALSRLFSAFTIGPHLILYLRQKLLVHFFGSVRQISFIASHGNVSHQ